MSDIVKLVEEVKQYIKDALDMHFNDLLKDAKKIGHNRVGDVLEHMAEYVRDKLTTVSNASTEDIIEAIKFAWNYNERHCSNYSFEEAIRWFKANIPHQITSEGCLLKQIQGRSTIVLHHCFIDPKSNTPLLADNYPYLIVYTLKLDSGLKEKFGSKDMLILR